MIDITSIVLPPGYRLVKIASVSAADDTVLHAVDRTWSRIMQEDARVPAAFFEIGPGRTSSCSSVGWDQRLPIVSINLMPQGEKMTGSDVLELLLHQAGHAVAGPTRAAEGRYHSPQFRKAAEGLGLAVSATRTGVGFPPEGLATGTRTRYKTQLAALDRALARWEPTDQVKTTRNERNGVAAVCSCGRKIRMRGRLNEDGKLTDFEVAPITCGRCGQPFLVTSAS